LSLLAKINVIKKRDYIPEKVFQQRWWILAVLCLSLLIVTIGNTSLNVALPSLSRELHATNSQLQWMVAAYSLVFAGFLFTAGTLGDRYGRKGILQMGLILFGLTSAYAAFIANSPNTIIAARAVMGLAGALIMPATLSIITNVFPRKERAKAVALWAGISGSGAVLGPLMAGYILEHAAWPAIFTLNLPLVLLAIVAGAILVPRTADPSHATFDFVGAILSIIGVSSLVYAIIEAPSRGWGSGDTLGILAISAVALAIFVWWESRVKHPMLDVRLFKTSTFGISSLSLTLLFFALYGMFFNISQLMQLVYGYSPFSAAVRFIPIAFALTIASASSPRLVNRFGKRRVVSTGMFIVTIGIAFLATITLAPNYPRLVVAIFITAFGIGLAMSPTTDLLMSSVPRSEAGMGSAMNDTTRELGGALGVAVLGSLLASHYVAKLGNLFAAFPAVANQAAQGSLAGALAVSGSVKGAAGVGLVIASKNAWLSAYRYSLVIAAVVMGIATIIAFIALPDRAADDIPEEGFFET